MKHTEQTSTAPNAPIATSMDTIASISMSRKELAWAGMPWTSTAGVYSMPRIEAPVSAEQAVACICHQTRTEIAFTFFKTARY